MPDIEQFRMPYRCVNGHGYTRTEAQQCTNVCSICSAPINCAPAADVVTPLMPTTKKG